MNHGTYWRGKRVLVAGASRGFGLTLAKELALSGARLVVCGRDQERIDASAAELARAGGSSAHSFAADLTRAPDVNALFEFAIDKLGGLDALFCCVGASSRGRVAEVSPEAFQAAWETNFLSAVRCVQASTESLLESQGHLVLIASLAAKLGAPFMGAYPAAKAPLAVYAQQLRMELGPEGLHVLLVCPGPIAGAVAAEERYRGAEVPAEARRAGGGAAIRALDPQKLAREVLAACEQRRPELVKPGKVRLLAAVSAIFPTLGDWILRRNTPSA